MQRQIIQYFLILSLNFPLAMGKIQEAKQNQNPLLIDWKTISDPSYLGVPPLDKIEAGHFPSAMESAMNKNRLEIQKITSIKEKPTFENTILPLEKSGKLFKQIIGIYKIWQSNINTEEFQKIDKRLSPLITSFSDEINLNSNLFYQIDQVYEDSLAKDSNLTPEQKKLVADYHQSFILSGAKLTLKEQKEVKKINKKLATLYNEFTNNTMADEAEMALIVDKKEDLKGLPKAYIEAAANEAIKRGLKGKWVFSNTRSAMQPFLTYADNRNLRKKAFEIWSSRGDNPNKNNNSKIISEISNLRQKRSNILGFKNYAEWSLQDTMAKKPEKALDLLMKIWDPAIKKVKQEIKEISEIAKADGQKNFQLEAYDYRYYLEKVRQKKYDFDMGKLTPYLELTNIQKAMFWTAEKLYGFNFSKVNDIPTFYPDVTVYKVSNKDRQQIGLWYFDPYARKGKRSGAWMSEYRGQSNLEGEKQTPLVSNNSNFLKGKKGAPIYLSWEDATTMFHEFGHALHGLASNVTYPGQAGTRVLRDFVEFPSQINEHFLKTPQVLNFLKNEKGEVLPQKYIKKLEVAKNFNQGFATVEYLASAIVDMKLHLSTEKDIDISQFEKNALKEIGMPKEIIMRHRLPHFNHLFAGEGYAAGYYSYAWAQVLEADAYEAFTKSGNPFNPKVAKKFLETILSVGGTVEPEVAFKNFRGREPKVEAFLKSKGFI